MSESLQCIVVTPEETVLDVSADYVVVPLFDGELGVFPGHAPLMGRLGYGELRIKRGGETSRYYVDGGFVQVADNVVSVLTNRAVAAAKIDRGVAEEQLQTALGRKASGAEELAIRDRKVSQARGLVRVANRG